jgi:putative hydrolase of the HAD superfamily
MNPNVKALLFDLGDVIINIDVPQAARSFAELAGRSHTEVLDLFAAEGLFRKFETGQLDASSFRDYLRDLLEAPHWDDATLDTAWNSLLLDIPPARVERLQALRERYPLYLLSNTSPIHVEGVNSILEKATGIPSLEQLFDRLFLSYEIGLMKPDKGIYTHVLEQIGLYPQEVLFLDDNADNIRAAASLGFETLHIQKPLTMLDYLDQYAAQY